MLGDGVVHQLGVALGDGLVLHAVLDAVEDHPVGADHAVPAGVAQDGDVVLGVRGAHVLAQAVGVIGIVGDAVAGHDGGHLLGLGVQVHAAVQERHQVRVEVAAGEDVPLAGVGVVVTAALVGALAHEVLEHHGAGLVAPALVVGGLVVAPGGLHAATEGSSEVAVQRRVLRHGAGGTGADGVGVDVDLGAEVAADARGTPRAGLPHAGLAPDVLVHDGGQADGGRHAKEDVRVRVVEVRNAVGALLADLLDLVDPLDVGGVGLDGALEARDARAGAGLDIVHGRGVGGGGAGLGAARPQEREQVVGAHHLGEGLGALVNGLAPVLVEVQLAVAVEVLERVAVDLDDLGGVHDAQDGAAVLVGDLGPAVTDLLGGPLGLDVVLIGLDGVLVGRGSRERVGGGATGVAAGQAHEACGQGGACEETPTRDVLHVFLRSVRVLFPRGRPPLIAAAPPLNTNERRASRHPA